MIKMRIYKIQQFSTALRINNIHFNTTYSLSKYILNLMHNTKTAPLVRERRYSTTAYYDIFKL